jgi:peptidoglycan hydrolase-like protein with peptidoglycan-binding domain
MSKSIQSSVGVGGHNVTMSVMTVQYLLNCVPAARGGPVPELAVDGIIGPKTIAAIRKFQTANLGFADGRVDPGGKTITALGAYDPYPNQPMGPGVVKTPTSPSTPFKSPGQPFGKQPSDPFGKQPSDPFDKQPSGPFGKQPSDPFGKQPSGPFGKQPSDPFGKSPPGKWGSGGKWGW